MLLKSYSTAETFDNLYQVSALCRHISTKQEKTMSAYSQQYVTKCAPWLSKSEAEAVYHAILDTSWDTHSVYEAEVIAVARDMFPYIQERKPAPISEETQKQLTAIRLREAIAGLASADRWLSKIRNGSDDIAMARRDIAMIIESLGGADNGS
jgi:hypothetical protein